LRGAVLLLLAAPRPSFSPRSNEGDLTEATSQHIGKFDFSVAVYDPAAEADNLRTRRQQAITACLLGQRDRQREESGNDLHLLN
jgi:hypothetical protein